MGYSTSPRSANQCLGTASLLLLAGATWLSMFVISDTTELSSPSRTGSRYALAPSARIARRMAGGLQMEGRYGDIEARSRSRGCKGRRSGRSGRRMAVDVGVAASPKNDGDIGSVWKSDGRLIVVNGTLELKHNQGELLDFEGGGRAVFIWERAAIYFAYLLPDSPVPEPGAKTFFAGEKLSMEYSPDVWGKGVDMFGRLAEEVGGEQTREKWGVFNPVPVQSDLQTIRRSMLTGVTAMDSLAPMGMGQNMLLIGHPSTGKSSLAATAAIAQQNPNLKVVYAALGDPERQSKILDTLEDTFKRGNLEGQPEYLSIVRPNYKEEGENNEVSEKEWAARQVVAASTAVAIGEKIRAEGGDVLVIIDDLSGHQTLWRLVCENLLEAAGGLNIFQGADDSAMRQYFSSLFQRVGKFNREKGSGSMSMLMVLETRPPPSSEGQEYSLDDFDSEMVGETTRNRLKLLADKGIKLTQEVLTKLEIPPPGTRTVETLAWIQDTDSMISLSDGHIFLDAKAYATGRRPAIDPSNSLTRVGIGSGVVQGQSFAPAIMKVAPRVRLDIAQIIQDKDQVSGEQQSNRMKAWLAVMHQAPGEVRPLSQQTVSLYAVGQGHLDAIASELGEEGVLAEIEKFYQLCKEEIPGVVEEIDSTQDLSGEGLVELARVMNGHFEKRSEAVVL